MECLESSRLINQMNFGESMIIFPISSALIYKGDILQVVYLDGLPDENTPNLYSPMALKALGMKGRPEKMDWESMTKDDNGNIYIADFGDNRSQRKYYPIHVISKPVNNIDKIFDYKTYNVCYPDQKSRNCEAIFFMNGKIYLITKVEGNNRNNENQKVFLFGFFN